MDDLRYEAKRFREKKAEEQSLARQAAALQLSAGIDIRAMIHASGEERSRLTLRLERLIERERLRGARRHWSYDLNRHISLKQALDCLRGIG